MSTPPEDEGPPPAPQVIAQRGRHVLTRTSAPRRLRASAVVTTDDGEGEAAGLSRAAGGVPVTLPPEIRRSRDVGTPGAVPVETVPVETVPVVLPTQRQPAPPAPPLHVPHPALPLLPAPLNRRRARAARPRWFVLAVLALSVLVLVVLAVVVALNETARNETADPIGEGGVMAAANPAAVPLIAADEARTTPIGDLRPGRCFQDLPDSIGPFWSVAVVACDQSHDNEVVAVFELAQRPWPGQQEVAVEAESRCRDVGARTIRATGIPRPGWQFWVLVPVEQGWTRSDDRTVQCMAYDPKGATTVILSG